MNQATIQTENINLTQETSVSDSDSRPFAIRVTDLRKSFIKRSGVRRRATTVWALKDLSFQMRIGETYGLLGPNGSGKSTLIRVLSTLLFHDGGQVEIFGRQLPGGERWIRNRIGRVSVDAAFYKKLSARENLLYAAQLYGITAKEAERKALEIFERLGLTRDNYYSPLEEMSRGMQQKVSIARAFIVNPPLLLLDEPTTGLDPKSKLDVQDYLEEVREKYGTTILLTTHDMAEAERLCGRVGFLSKGRITAEGSANELKRIAGADNLEEAFIKLSGRKFEDEE